MQGIMKSFIIITAINAKSKKPIISFNKGLEITLSLKKLFQDWWAALKTILAIK